MYICIFYIRTFTSKQSNEIAETETIFVRGCILYECMNKIHIIIFSFKWW